MASNLEADIQYEQFMDPKKAERLASEPTQPNYSTLINYWNNNQVVHMAGLARKDALDRFIKSLERINPRAKIHINSSGFQDLGVNFLDSDELNRELLSLREKGLQFSQQLIKMRPSLRYAILALLSANKFNIFNQGLIDFMAMLNNGGWNDKPMTADFGAFLIDHINLFKELDYKDDSSGQIEALFIKLRDDQALLQDFKRIQEDQNSISQRRVLVTPTLYHFTVARVEEGNKVLRQYREHLSQFIRLSFATEELDKGFYFLSSSRYLLGYIHSVLKNGFYAGRNLKSKFLSYSNSQFKNHTCWFLSAVAENYPHLKHGVTERIIIDSMGEFDHEKNILKRYARRGQCFSTTKKVQDLLPGRVLQGYPDEERNGHCFSDGCGWIHPELADKVAHAFKHTHMSAFQIRIGGAKGVLATNNNLELFQKEEGGENDYYQVLLRSSQMKFPAGNLTLELVRCATFSQGYLNRQLIVLLHCLGAPIEFFLKKQFAATQFLLLNQTLARINKKIEVIHRKFGNLLDSFQPEDGHTSSADLTLAKNMRLKDLARDMKLSIEPCKNFQATLKQAMIKGMDVQAEPVLSSVLYTMQLNQFMHLKKKARIILPDSCVLIGIIDPSDTLEHGEVFVQTRKDSFSKHRHGHGISDRTNRMEHAEVINGIESMAEIITGDVLVSRNPCHHPGDVRLLKSVDKRELRHLFNVVVFSSKGDRP